jgi:hypothetical protein
VNAAAQDKAAVDTTAVLEEAHHAMMAWLEQVDQRDYQASWDSAATALKAAVTPEQWSASLAQARGSIPEIANRTLVSATYTTAIPNAPAGEYVIHVFSANAGSMSLIETVSMMRDSDGTWRAGGYFIRPG